MTHPVASRLRVLLVLGRVSNLPTVWSNCLAAWWLGGGRAEARLALLIFSATLLYVGGMFLNDAFDVEFDRRYRPERPIIAGEIGHSTVWILGATWLALGWFALLLLGTRPAAFGFGLLLAIVIYDATHKRIALAPLLMAACRFLLYLVAASAALGVTWPILWRAIALAAYILGLSLLARGESTGATARRRPIVVLLVAPVAIAAGSGVALSSVMISALLIGWVFWCLAMDSWRPVRFIPRGVAGLLAGIVWVDWLAAASAGAEVGGAFAALFLLALLLQRAAPAT